MTDFRVQTTWRCHRKRKRLRRELGADAVLAIEDLWSYAAEYRTDGNLAGMTDEDICDEVDYPGDIRKLTTVLRRIGLLDGEEGSYRLHDWKENQPHVASSSLRSVSAASAIHARWHKEGKHSSRFVGGCPLCAAENTAAKPYERIRSEYDPNSPSLPTIHPSMREIHASGAAAPGEQERPITLASLSPLGLSLPKASDVMTAEMVEAVLSNVEGWRIGGSMEHSRIAACCPVSGEKFLAALAKTKSEATKPNFKYFAGCLETECQPRARRGPKRVSVSKQDESFRAALEATYGPGFATTGS